MHQLCAFLSCKESVAILSAKGRKLIPQPFAVFNILTGQINVLRVAIGAGQCQNIVVSSPIVFGNIALDSIAIITVPPLSILGGPEREGHAGYVTAIGAWR